MSQCKYFDRQLIFQRRVPQAAVPRVLLCPYQQQEQIPDSRPGPLQGKFLSESIRASELGMTQSALSVR